MATTRLTISVTNIADIMASFNAIRIKRSTTGISGTYDLLTANAPEHAALLAPTAGNYDVVGKTLKLQIDQNDEVDVLFTGIGILTVPQVVSQINVALGATIASDSSNHLLLTSVLTGTISKIIVVGGDAITAFGWTAGKKALGKESHITLQTGVSVYSFLDNDGGSDYYYRAQYYNTATLLSSADSEPFEGDVGTLVTADQLCRIKVDLVDGRGVAIPNQEITFYPQHEPLEVEGFQVALNRAPITVKTDNAGHAEVSLVRGLHVRVVFEGTSIIRDIDIPDAAEANLLHQMSLAPDPYSITEMPFPPAPRRTL